MNRLSWIKERKSIKADVIKKVFVRHSLILIIIFGPIFFADAQMTPHEAILKMTCGINVGRSLELANESDAGGRYIKEYYFEDFKTAGFDFVRIPIQWDQHTGTSKPFEVDTTWLNRVEEVIDWSLNHGLMTIINSHHDRWILDNNNYTASDLERFDSIWSQVAYYFRDKSDSLIFEIGNEPNIALRLVDTINAHVIPLIRKTNPTRIIVFGSSGTQLSTLKNAVIPIDNYLIASFHTYVPWPFAGEGKGTWGSNSEINAVKSLMTDAATWSDAHNIPLLLGEFGTVGSCEPWSRMKWFSTHLDEARKRNIAPAVWQDFGNFSVYFNTTNPAAKWNTSIKDIIVYTNPLSPESLAITIENETNANIKWENRDTAYNWIRLERKEGTGTYKSLDTMDGSATSYLDETTMTGKTYTYRVVAELSDGKITYSFPVEKKIELPSTNAIDEKVKQSDIGFITYIYNNQLFINTSLLKNNASFYGVYTISGQVIRSGEVLSDVIQVDTSDLAKGIYLVNVSDTNGMCMTRRIVKI